jgi:hypothetical protein
MRRWQGPPVAGHAGVRQGAARVSTIVFGAISISINSVPMSSSGSVKLRYEKCLQVWGNARRRRPPFSVALGFRVHG